MGGTKTYFCRFANFLPNDFPFVGVVFFDRGKQLLGLGNFNQTSSQELDRNVAQIGPYFFLPELCIMHVLAFFQRKFWP